jgi:CubicO group peptidase (beta-lactamase class C family)
MEQSHKRIRRHAAWVAVLAAVSLAMPATAQVASKEAIAARGKKLELGTPLEPPPGDPLVHYASGYAKVICSALFVTGLDLEFAIENVGYFTAPPSQRARLGKPEIDRVRREVRVAVPGGPTRVARYVGSQGCITLPLGESSLRFEPVRVESALPPAASLAWPMGDRLPDSPLPAEIDQSKLKAALAAAFEPAKALTAAFVVTHRGRIIGERYGDGITSHSRLESWSMGKSLAATLMGVLVGRGVYRLDQPAPIPEWRETRDDPRARITLADLLHMSSGLQVVSFVDPDYDPSGPYSGHEYLYTGGVNSCHYAATRPSQWPPNTVGRYRNTDPVLVSCLIRLGVERGGDEYLSFPQRALFDRLGIRDAVLETDPYGNFLLQGYELLTARDWARLGNLYLQNGVWEGERILPEGWTQFVRTVAPAWKADGNPVYGGFFWINGDGELHAPRDAYSMQGAGGQYAIIIPSHDLVVVRLGAFGGAELALASLNHALAELLEAVPRR